MLGHVSVKGVAIALVVVLGVPLFVVFYEEQALRKKFGAEYQEY